MSFETYIETQMNSLKIAGTCKYTRQDNENLTVGKHQSAYSVMPHVDMHFKAQGETFKTESISCKVSGKKVK